jgi:hypothetical protein
MGLLKTRGIPGIEGTPVYVVLRDLASGRIVGELAAVLIVGPA